VAGKNDTAVGLAADLQLVSEFAGTDIVRVEYSGSHTQMRLQLKPGCSIMAECYPSQNIRFGAEAESESVGQAQFWETVAGVVYEKIKPTERR